MKSTLADIKQLFNVKAIAYSVNINSLQDGQFGIFAEGSEVSIPTGTTYATLPDEFRIVSKLDGKIYYSFDTIKKSTIYNTAALPYKAEQVNIWEAVIKNCDCINGVMLKVNIDEQSLIQRDGLTWTHSDFAVVVSPQELACLCSCDGTSPVYENHVMTALLYKNIIAKNSPFYTAKVLMYNEVIGQEPSAGTEDELNNIPTEEGGFGHVFETGDMYIYVNGAYTKIGKTQDRSISDPLLLAELLKAKNTKVGGTPSSMFKLQILGILQETPFYRDLEINYVFPRGARLAPAIVVNGKKSIAFTEVQKLGYELGAGYDLRAEEFENMSLYTNLNFYPRLSDGIANQDLQYQFENKKNYSGVAFEFTSDKVERNSGDKKLFGVSLSTENASVYTALKNIFIK